MKGLPDTMTRQRFSTLAEQVAQEIRDGLQAGRWTQSMPGRKTLAGELGVNHKTCESALQLLEGEGLLVSQGRGRGRRIVESATPRLPTIRVKILLYEKSSERSYYLVELLHRLREAGHDACFVEKTMVGLGMSAERIIRYARRIEADAWIVLAGSQEVLEWFAQQTTPAFALYGRTKDVPMASIAPSKYAAMEDLVGRLVAMGHQRIVLLTREERRKPSPGLFEQRFLEELEKHGIATGAYNLPEWEDCPEALHEKLESLFRHTPPSCMIIDEFSLFVAVMQKLGQMGIKVPEQVSLACLDQARAFDWCRPEITHFQWDSTGLVNRMEKWVHNVTHGKQDRRTSLIKAKLFVGGTIGPAPE